jgi:starch synthase
VLEVAGSEYRYLRVAAPSPAPQVYLVDAPDISAGGVIYTGDERDAARFIRFSEAALHLGPALGWAPQIVHCHDWHAAAAVLFAAASTKHKVRSARTVLTLHNVGYQGIFSAAVLAQSGHPELEPQFDRTDFANDTINLLKAGITHADQLTTVSPTYAQEVQTPAYGMGMETLLHARRDDLAGILNGVDYSLWAPDRDPYIEPHYDAGSAVRKRSVKHAMRKALGLSFAPDGPVIGMVSRLVAQKGIDLMIEALPALLAHTQASFALLGGGEAGLCEALASLAASHRGRVAFTEGYNEALAHQIIAGADMLAVPSRYEPCGLTQLYAMRYGTIPIVRATGGLADTVQHFDPVRGSGTGSVFEHADVQGLLWGTEQALAWFSEPAHWQRLMANAMGTDYSWSRQAAPYEAVYHKALGA